MAHAFKIVDTSGVVTTYTDYDDIPLSTLRHVISFLPDIGTEEQANEILLEPESTVTDNVATEDEVGLETVIVTDADDNLIMEIADGVDRLVPEDFADGLENHLVLELVEGDNHIGPFVRLETGTTDVLLDEDGGRIPFDHIVGDAVGANHHHPPAGDFHVDGDGHTEEEHREIALWGFKLQKLITQENTNASSL
tara:strand:- start:1383 stop:1967 length:585 start_codon:yes stop_codon:yes gene_type:complete